MVDYAQTVNLSSGHFPCSLIPGPPDRYGLQNRCIAAKESCPSPCPGRSTFRYVHRRQIKNLE